MSPIARRRSVDKPDVAGNCKFNLRRRSDAGGGKIQQFVLRGMGRALV
jgi:hypothetical protein